MAAADMEEERRRKGFRVFERIPRSAPWMNETKGEG